ncbi:hypothetical protein B7494_g842 [Chlorociboria aeruginascens]|nr:hypothetical protein B7494_g842 [Chlorociboria aeruginascens]
MQSSISPPKPLRSAKIAHLMSALDDVLVESELDEVLRTIGEEALNQCVDLRASLRRRNIQPVVEINTPPSSRSHDTPNLAKIMSATNITPWTASSISQNLPPLPAILDPTLEVAAFTHSGCANGRIGVLSYERLEWVGDSYIYVISTLLIAQTFPSFSPGKCSQLRERLVKNITLAGFARRYNFSVRAKLPNSFTENTAYRASADEANKVMGDIFEAYVAAVVLSDPLNGIARVYEWLKCLWAMTLAKEIMDEVEKGEPFDNPMWRLRGNTDPVENPMAAGPRKRNAKEQLAAMIGGRSILITYKDIAPERKDKETKLPLFTVGVYLDGYNEKNMQLGWGTAHGKKEAGMKAAEMALANQKMIKSLNEKKKFHDLQREMETKALEDQNTDV